MTEIYRTGVLVVASVFCLLTTTTAAVFPVQFAARLGLCVTNPGGANEVRAQYAGFFLAVAIACLAGLSGALPKTAAFVVLIVTFGGLIGGRLAGLGFDRGAGGYPPAVRALFAVDLIGLGLALVAYLAGSGS